MYREEEREMMPTLAHFGAGVIPWGPLGGGREYSSRGVEYPFPLYQRRRASHANFLTGVIGPAHPAHQSLDHIA
jgi:aryl-alcohol dehydrogenase-like predicted oxidoreductase